MEDRFKFRAWTGKEMITGGIGLIDGQPGPGLEHWKIMQCTGLKDKNGKLIFEGDILKYWEPIGGKESNFAIIAPVEWDGVSWSLKIWRPGKSDFQSGEVIGNIYYNPELLTREDKENG